MVLVQKRIDFSTRTEAMLRLGLTRRPGRDEDTEDFCDSIRYMRHTGRTSAATDRRNYEDVIVTVPFESDLKTAIRSIPDYPKPGIMFRDITTLLGDARAFRRTVDELVQPWAGGKIDKVAGIEARGFILGGAVAHQVSAGFVPIRKKGKLPFKRVSIGYSLEYGIDEMEMHEDAVVKGERVILVDDLVATGGTAEAAVKLLKQIGAEVLAACFIVDLPDLGGAERIRKLGVPVRTLVAFEGH
jgi:adenine phosphoribosyltransferase